MSLELQLHASVPLEPGERDRLMGVAISMSAAVDFKCSYHAHGQGVADVAHAIASTLGIEGEALFRITLAGLLHDVGKLRIPDRVILKPTQLNDAEYEHVRQHPLLGHEVLVAMSLHDEARWVLHHHERRDGHGYPSGLVGEQIPLGARILLVADAWDCMTNPRPYQAALSPAAASAEILAHVDDQFDGMVVAALPPLTVV